MKNLATFFVSLLRPSAKHKATKGGDLVVKAAQGSTWAVRHYGKALEKLAEYDRAK